MTGHGRLVAWLALVLTQAAINYGDRAAGGKPPKDVLYHYSTAAAGLVLYGIVLGLVLLIAAGAKPRRLLALRPPLSWGRAAGGALVVLIGIFALLRILDPFLHPGREQGLTPSGWDSSRAGAYAANFAVIALAAPIVEELTFRGLGFSLLERFGRPAAIMLVGIAFGLAHGLIEALPVLAAFGAGLAWLRARTESVYPSIALHAAFNAIALTLAVTT